jgi:hypothetical protein
MRFFATFACAVLLANFAAAPIPTAVAQVRKIRVSSDIVNIRCDFAQGCRCVDCRTERRERRERPDRPKPPGSSTRECRDGWTRSSQGCIPEGTVDCGAYYCQAGTMCIGNKRCLTLSSVQACSDGKKFCKEGFACTSGHHCLPAKRVCSDRTTYCVSGGMQCFPGNICRAEGSFKCGDDYCPRGSLCIGDGKCLAISSRRVCSDRKAYCVGEGMQCFPGNICRAEGSFRCGNDYCPPGNLCARGGKCLALTSRRVCSDRKTYCVGEGMQCFDGNICRAEGSFRCGNDYCPPGNLCTSGGKCLALTSRRVCSDRTTYCVSNGMQCFPGNICRVEGSFKCGDDYCPPGNLCARGGKCLALTSRRVCSDRKTYCVGEGMQCFDGNICRVEGSFRCGDDYCPPGNLCARGGKCLALTSGRVCSDGKTYCVGEGMQCLAGNVCRPEGSFKCGVGFCSLGSLCTGNAKCVAVATVCANGQHCDDGAVISALRSIDERLSHIAEEEQQLLRRLYKIKATFLNQVQDYNKWAAEAKSGIERALTEMKQVSLAAIAARLLEVTEEFGTREIERLIERAQKLRDVRHASRYTPQIKKVVDALREEIKVDIKRKGLGGAEARQYAEQLVVRRLWLGVAALQDGRALSENVIQDEIKRLDLEQKPLDPAKKLRAGYEATYNYMLTGAQLVEHHWKSQVETMSGAFGVLGLAPDMIESAAIVAESFIDQTHIDALGLSLRAAEREREVTARIVQDLVKEHQELMEQKQRLQSVRRSSLQ